MQNNSQEKIILGQALAETLLRELQEGLSTQILERYEELYGRHETYIMLSTKPVPFSYFCVVYQDTKLVKHLLPNADFSVVEPNTNTSHLTIAASLGDLNILHLILRELEKRNQLDIIKTYPKDNFGNKWWYYLLQSPRTVDALSLIILHYGIDILTLDNDDKNFIIKILAWDVDGIFPPRLNFKKLMYALKGV